MWYEITKMSRCLCTISSEPWNIITITENGKTGYNFTWREKVGEKKEIPHENTRLPGWFRSELIVNYEGHFLCS